LVKTHRVLEASSARTPNVSSRPSAPGAIHWVAIVSPGAALKMPPEPTEPAMKVPSSVAVMLSGKVFGPSMMSSVGDAAAWVAKPSARAAKAVLGKALPGFQFFKIRMPSFRFR
jgi:hypothetical protein